jgi:hypothetical protein
MITAMTLWFEDNTEWAEIKDAILAEWEERRKSDGRAIDNENDDKAGAIGF